MVRLSPIFLCGNVAAAALNFTACDKKYGLSKDYECGMLAVPIDYSKPATTVNNTVNLWISRRRARKQKNGTLFFNFGGPGLAGSHVFEIQTALEAATGETPLFPSEVLDTMDIVAMDMRGSRYSSPMTCDAETYNNEPSLWTAATSDAEFQKLVDYNRKIGTSCPSALIQNMDTPTVVEDMETLRKALVAGGGGSNSSATDDKISFLGLSYGTIVGMAYAAKYGEHVSHMVLDGVIDHASSKTVTDAIFTVGSGFEATIQRAFAWCNATGSTDKCALYGRDQAALFKQLTAPVTSLERVSSSSSRNATFANQSNPDPAFDSDCVGCQAKLTRSRMLLNTRDLIALPEGTLGSPSWATFFQYLQNAVEKPNNVSGFATAAEVPGQPDTSFSSRYVYRAALCQDWGSPLKSAADLRKLLTTAALQLPIGRAANWPLEAAAFCTGWPAPVTYAPGTAATPTKLANKSVLLASSYYDPGTPGKFAVSLGLTHPGLTTSIWRDGSGHTSYFLRGATWEAMNSFLVNGTVPQRAVSTTHR